MADSFFHGKVALVTGASSGIGLETARLLASQGAKVTLAARRLEAVEALASEIQAKGGEALPLRADVTRREDVDAAVQATLARWGRIDILVSNAGQYLRAPIPELTVEIVERSLAVNFYGGLYAVLAVLPSMRRQGSGHIVFVASMDARTALVRDAPYVAAKFATAGFADVLRQELHGSGIFVSVIFPGRVDTPMIAHIQVPSASAKISPESVAEAILVAIRKRKAEMIMPRQVWLLYLFRFLSPRLFDWTNRILHPEGQEIPQDNDPSI